MWSPNAFVPLVLSWQERCRKPDPRLYATAARRLGVGPGECWYAGDGGGRELTGARRAGMRPVLVTNAGVPGAARHRVDPGDVAWEYTVDDLTGLLPLLGEPA